MAKATQVFNAQWLLRGYFDFKARERRDTLTRSVRDELARCLDVPADLIKISSYPVGPNYRHTYWWRLGEIEYAEIQFFARIAKEHAVLSLGVSIEKGLEDAQALKGRPVTHRLNRKAWHWPHFLRHALYILSTDLPKVQRKLDRPIFVRILTKPSSQDAERTFTMVNGRWYERHVGHTGPATVIEHFRRLDTKPDLWVNAYIGIDLTSDEADGLTAPKLVNIMLAFDPVRERVRR